MPPATTLGLLILVVAVLPGSVYTWAYERQASAFGASFTDRTLRFVAVSLCFQLVLAWPEYGAYRFLAASSHGFGTGEFSVVWLVLVILILFPLGFGTVLGGLYATRTTRDGWQWIRRLMSADMELSLLSLLLGRTPAPQSGALVGDAGRGIPVYVPAGQVQFMEVVPESSGEDSGGERHA